ncbi:MAG TPA: hypothetical protein VK698_16485 [Kofleriaceae bacterium]|nr:hypothetical protein [Kofleriaceae bacterium]
MSSGKTRSRRKLEGACVMPVPVHSDQLPRLMVAAQPEHEIIEIRDYFERQGREPVVHLEKVASERIFGNRHDVWDIHTATGRWWVVTKPTNLYSQKDFPSLDYILSFHVGLCARLMARSASKASVSDEEQDRLASPLRRWEQAAEALNSAEEAEDFQAVGMRCRECLIELVRGVARPEMVATGVEAPKKADFVQWAEVIANAVTAGASAAELRGYLKAVSKSTWQLVNWLTHAKSATRLDAQIALDATENVLAALGLLVVRHERGAPDRCPACGSYQIGTLYRPEVGAESSYFSVCIRCDWSDLPLPPASKRRTEKKRPKG